MQLDGKNALFAWEIGSGLGHIGVLSPIMARFIEAGMQCTLVAKEVTSAGRLAPRQVRKRQAPPLHELNRNAISYAELLLNVGFHNPIIALSVVTAWLKILEAERPDLLVADAAPFAILAARILRIPTLVVGTAFNLPPPVTPQPFFRPWEGQAPLAELKRLEDLALASINRVLAQSGVPRISKVYEMYDHAMPILCARPGLDHFERDPSCQPVRYAGPIRLAGSGKTTPWPEGAGPKMFLHILSTSPLFEPVLSALANLSARVIAYVPDAKKPGLTGTTLISAVPVDLDASVSDADAAITQGNLATSFFFIDRGIQVMSAPRTVEQALTAFRMQEAGVGSILATGMPLPAIERAIGHALQKKRATMKPGAVRTDGVSMVLEAGYGVLDATASP